MPSVDVVTAIYGMTKGATMLKAGRMGRPHFRQFRLTEDLSQLQWDSPKKAKGESFVAIQQIQQLIRGQKTKVFEGNPIPEYESLSFSLVYKQANIQRSLDIVCKDRTEHDIWTTGLDALLNGFNDVTAVRQLADSLGVEKVDGQSNKISLEFVGLVGFVGFGGEKVSVKEDACDIYTWGASPKGTLGHGDEAEERIPRVVEALLGRDVRMIACGTEHMLAVSASGELFSWGSGRGGKLGLGHIQDRYTPLKVSTLAQKEVTCIACHELHSAAVTRDGELYTWGRAGPRLGYEVGEGKQTSPRLVESLVSHKVEKVDCGLEFTIALTTTGKVFSFGENEFGQLGLGDTEPRETPSEVNLQGIKIIAVACGAKHAGVVTTYGNVWMWGVNDFGQLGTGNLTNQYQPRQVSSDYWNEKILNISCGDRHSAVLSEEHQWRIIPHRNESVPLLQRMVVKFDNYTNTMRTCMDMMRSANDTYLKNTIQHKRQLITGLQYRQCMF